MDDDDLQAQSLVRLMQNQGVGDLGPAPGVEEGMGLRLRNSLPGMAVLDTRLGKGKVFPLVEALRTMGIPFVFASGSPDQSLPDACEGLPHCETPLDERALLRRLATLSRVR